MLIGISLHIGFALFARQYKPKTINRTQTEHIGYISRRIPADAKLIHEKL